MIRNDPKLYSEMTKDPFASNAAADDAIRAFFDEVDAARKRHRVPNVVVLAKTSYVADALAADPQAVEGMATLFLGDSREALPMLAHAFGAEQNAANERIARIIAAAKSGRGA